MSKINIDRIVNEITIRSTSLTPIIEAICNSIDAIRATGRPDGEIKIVVKRDGQMSFDDKKNTSQGEIIAIDVIDNGIGFNEENTESFDTFRSALKIDKGGKGFGRFMYLKYFSKVDIESIYKENDEYIKHTFEFGHRDEIIENEHKEIISQNAANCLTLK